MSDDEIERRLTRFTVMGPSQGLRRRILEAAERRGLRKDAVIGWLVAAALVLCATAGAWRSALQVEQRLNDALEDAQVTERSSVAVEMFDGEERRRIGLTYAAAIVETRAEAEGVAPW